MWNRWRFWILAAAAAIVVVIVLLLLRGTGQVSGRPLAADEAGPAGSRALAQVLQERGVDVRIVDTLSAATAAAGDGRTTTLLLADVDGILSAEQLRRAGAIATHTVIASPDFRALQALAGGVTSGGAPAQNTLDARCGLSAATRAGSVTAGGRTLSVTHGEWTRCFPAGGDRFGVLQSVSQGRTTTLIADAGLMRNDTVTSHGDAALALGLLGGQPRLVWYLPTLADVTVAGKPTLAELTPGWVTPVLLLGAAVFLAAAVWRGRRFGPLVVENLPVIVPARETTEGRARLYARSSARLRAADALRIGAVGRMAARLGLPRSATVDDVGIGISSVTGIPRQAVDAILLTEEPKTDATLVALSNRLGALESAVHDATDSSAPTPTPTSTSPETGMPPTSL